MTLTSCYLIKGDILLTHTDNIDLHVACFRWYEYDIWDGEGAVLYAEVVGASVTHVIRYKRG